MIWYGSQTDHRRSVVVKFTKTWQKCASFIALYPHDVPETISEWIIYLYVIIHVIIYIYDIYICMHVYVCICIIK